MEIFTIDTNIYFQGVYELCIRLYFIDFSKLLPKKRQFRIDRFLWLKNCSFLESFSRITSRWISVVPGWSQGNSWGPKEFYGVPRVLWVVDVPPGVPEGTRESGGSRDSQGSRGSRDWILLFHHTQIFYIHFLHCTLAACWSSS